MEEDFSCPECGSKEVLGVGDMNTEQGWKDAICGACGHKYTYDEYVAAIAQFSTNALLKGL